MSATDACRHCGLPIPESGTVSVPDVGFCCFGCSVAHEITTAAEGKSSGSLSPVHVRIALAVLFSMGVMMFSLISYSDFVAWEDADNAAQNAFSQLFSYLAFLAAVPVIVLLGRPMLRRLRDARRGHSVWLEILVLFGVTAAFVLSAANLIRGSGHTYFETVVFTLLLWSVGRYVEAMVRTRTMMSLRDAVAGSSGIVQKVERSGGDTPTETHIADLQIGDRIRLYAGDVVPVDGRIRSGRAFVDESVTSGEFLPLVRGEGDALRAGTTVVDATIDLELTSDPASSTLVQLGDAVSRAVTERGRISQAADRASRVLVFVTLGLGFAAFGWWFVRAGLEPAILSALSVFLVACPCSLGIAVPLVVYFGLQRARQRGVLFRSGEALERAGQIDKLYLDKTGTLTAGRPRFEGLRIARSSPFSEEQLWPVIAAIERESRHPFASAVSAHAKAHNVATGAISACRTVPGSGMVAHAEDLGVEVRIGASGWMVMDTPLPDDLATRIDELTRGHHPVSLVSVNGQAVALLEFSEDTETETITALESLRDLEPEILTGAQTVTGSLTRWPATTGLSPEAKAARLAAAVENGRRPAMVGDGLNDAVALAAADLGVAVAGAQDVNRVVSDVLLLAPGAGALTALFSTARLARRRIWQNIIWSAAYNTIGLSLAASGNLHPLAAAVAMFVSSMVVLWNSRRWEKR